LSIRAGIVVTGTEVLSGKVQDRNGPWLADRLFELGIELAHITIVGDRREDMEAQLRFLADQGVDLIVTSGGLGPTADDLTAEVVGRFQERPLELSEEMERKIAEILKPLMKRFQHLDKEAVMDANRKQAMIPRGATAIDPAGTAPGLVVPPPNGRGGPTVVVMPGPPRELHSMWPVAVETPAFQAAVAGRTVYEERMLRLFGIPESEIAETLRIAERSVPDFSKLEITTCLRRGELEVSARYEPEGEEAWGAIEDLIAERYPAALFSRDGSRIDDQVAELLAGHWFAAAESITGGLLVGRLVERPGASEYVAGGVVSYSNESKS
jgi:nicotinamide-nucleotide amidase